MRMAKVVSFYEKLPRGPAPKIEPKGLMQRYQNAYFNGKNASAMREYRSEPGRKERCADLYQPSFTSLSPSRSSDTDRTTTSICVSPATALLAMLLTRFRPPQEQCPLSGSLS